MATVKASEQAGEKKKVKKIKQSKEKSLEDAAAEIKALKKALRKAEKEKNALAELRARSPHTGAENRRSPRLAAIAMAEMPPLLLLPGKRARDSEGVQSPKLKAGDLKKSKAGPASPSFSSQPLKKTRTEAGSVASSFSSPYKKSASSFSSSSSSSASSSSASTALSAKPDPDLDSKRSALLVVSSAEYQKLHSVTVLLPRNTTMTSPDPIQNFEQASKFFYEPLMKAVALEGFIAPSPIQAMCWPFVMGGSDIIAIAKTGSGKTIGFLFPAFVHITKNYPLALNREGPIAIVVAPTRELAVQIELEAQKFAKTIKIQCACIYGGVPKGPQIGKMMRGVHVCIATPGRLNDFLEMKNPPVTNLKRCTYVVLDEADRMLDMGFEPQIRSIFDQLPKDTKHQTLMFSATWPRAVQTLAREFLTTPVQINIGGDGKKLLVNTDVTQEIIQVSNKEKEDKLVEILQKIQSPDLSCIVFANKKSSCDRLAYHIRRKLEGFGAVSIHGDKDQYERTEALRRFVNGEDKIIVATDVAARGLDIKGVSHVINFDFPCAGAEDWVHRVGRTGRAGKTGIAYTFFCEEDDRKSAVELVQILKDANQTIPAFLTGLAQRMARPRGGGGSRGGGRGGSWGGGGGGRGRGGQGSWSSGGRYGGSRGSGSGSQW
jgi:ATP-dependent RNA helicase DDX5/DBP2